MIFDPDPPIALKWYEYFFGILTLKICYVIVSLVEFSKTQTESDKYPDIAVQICLPVHN